MKTQNTAIWLLLTTGFLGGYTTFSSLTANTWELFENGQTNTALINAAASLLLGITSAAIGFACGRWWHA
jgi:CrcB protein